MTHDTSASLRCRCLYGGKAQHTRYHESLERLSFTDPERHCAMARTNQSQDNSDVDAAIFSAAIVSPMDTERDSTKDHSFTESEEAASDCLLDEYSGLKHDERDKKSDGRKRKEDSDCGDSLNEYCDELDKKPAGRKCEEASNCSDLQSPQQDDSALSVSTRSRSRSSTASFTTDTTSEREVGTEIGSRVYAKWENGGWYFAEIVDIKRKFKSHFDQYSLLFYDGDFIEYASRKSFITRRDYEKVFDKEIPAPPKAHQQRLRRLKSQKPSAIESHAVSSSMTLEKLLENKCGECVNCTKDDCGRCASCVSHPNTQVCIQKMCCQFSVHEKAQPMPPEAMFPDGWKFVIDPTMTREAYQRGKVPVKGTEGLKILPPILSRGTYYSVEGAIGHHPVSLRRVRPRIFYAHIGVVTASRSLTGRYKIEYESSDDEPALTRPNKLHRADAISSDEIKATDDHFLVGRNFCFMWTNLNRQNKMVHGKVTECEKHVGSGEAVRFRVTYSPQLMQVLNLNNIGHWLVIPESQVLPSPLVFGGCILYEQYMQVDNDVSPLQSYLSTEKPFYWSWITADLSHEELVHSNYGEPLPRLTLMLRGFRLELSVKPSRIPNAGYGVFLSCMKLMEDASDDETVDAFVLKAGELVDLGIYAPFQIQDKKPEAVTFVKNFVHSYKIEKWTFNAKDIHYQLDITDDVTGNLHAAAKSHIPAYVNESNDDDLVNIRAEHDPEGCVHYLLGHSIQSQGAFVVPTDGSEVELHVNYGALYERVRIRNGYSFVCDEERACITEQISHENVEDVEEMDRFEEADIEACVNYFLMLFAMEDESKFTGEVVQRALICAAVLQRRASRLLLEGAGGDYSPAKKVAKKAGLLVSRLLGMVKVERDSLKMLQETGEYDELLRRVLGLLLSAEELRKLDKMMN